METITPSAVREGRIRIHAPRIERVRLTIPAREALEAGGSTVTEVAAQPHRLYYDVDLVRPPAGIRRVLIGQWPEQHRGLRMADELPYPGEWPDDVIAWYERGELAPCPHAGCGLALVWYEAGYVPGYRVCLAGHHAQLASDGRSARAVDSYDE